MSFYSSLLFNCISFQICEAASLYRQHHVKACKENMHFSGLEMKDPMQENRGVFTWNLMKEELEEEDFIKIQYWMNIWEMFFDKRSSSWLVLPNWVSLIDRPELGLGKEPRSITTSPPNARVAAMTSMRNLLMKIWPKDVLAKTNLRSNLSIKIAMFHV